MRSFKSKKLGKRNTSLSLASWRIVLRFFFFNSLGISATRCWCCAIGGLGAVGRGYGEYSTVPGPDFWTTI